MLLVMTVKTVSTQADCPNEEDYSPCTCYRYDDPSRNPSVNCASNLSEISSVFKRTTAADIEVISIDLVETDPIKIIPADLINNHRAEYISIGCASINNQPLKVDSQAFRSSKDLINGVQSYNCDLNQFNFEFMSGFNLLSAVSFNRVSNFGRANWTSFPNNLPSMIDFYIYGSTGLNEWVTFPRLTRGFTFVSLISDGIQNEAMSRILNWTLQYSANTLIYLTRRPPKSGHFFTLRWH